MKALTLKSFGLQADASGLPRKFAWKSLTRLTVTGTRGGLWLW